MKGPLKLAHQTGGLASTCRLRLERSCHTDKHFTQTTKTTSPLGAAVSPEQGCDSLLRRICEEEHQMRHVLCSQAWCQKPRLVAVRQDQLNQELSHHLKVKRVIKTFSLMTESQPTCRKFARQALVTEKRARTTCNPTKNTFFSTIKTGNGELNFY